MADYRDGPTIMVADDTEDARFVLRTFLESNGYRVVEARDRREAVELARKECPDLVLMDLNMPELDGLAAIGRTRACRDACQKVPVLAITDYDTYGIRDTVIEAGGDEYLSKPLNLDYLGRVVHRLLNRLWA